MARPTWLVAYMATLAIAAATILGITGDLGSESVAAIISSAAGLTGGFVIGTAAATRRINGPS